ncbi:hypothetical protein C9J01_02535 [Photobacterium rosenbergii]|uniref:Uncharacterized protein n=1 Tax=Photobacterium rosenbergii TaxID=294936 RepID=A0A2T3NK74_9GAMM|nr:hypothetical protein [Photobacterium rosenbergii]PSW15907.1 hypothetical protein C9J01_02535 [Photobacterium rosenbergii]
MITESVKADDGGTEGKWVALAIAVILVIAFFALPYHQAGKVEDKLESYQVSINEIPSSQLAMIAELRLAHEEIRNVFQDNLDSALVSEQVISNSHWPLVDELESFWLAPFIKDKSWQHKGRHLWEMVAEGVYLGVPQELGPNQENTAIVLISTEIEPIIWFKSTSVEKAIETPSSFTSSALAEFGWSQVSFPDSKHRHSH